MAGAPIHDRPQREAGVGCRRLPPLPPCGIAPLGFSGSSSGPSFLEPVRSIQDRGLLYWDVPSRLSHHRDRSALVCFKLVHRGCLAAAAACIIRRTARCRMTLGWMQLAMPLADGGIAISQHGDGLTQSDKSEWWLSARTLLAACSSSNGSVHQLMARGPSRPRQNRLSGSEASFVQEVWPGAHLTRPQNSNADASCWGSLMAE